MEESVKRGKTSGSLIKRELTELDEEDYEESDYSSRS
jgi:hypothetical protein